MAPQAESARVVGRYEVLDEIAAGGMATVHLGRVLGQASPAPRFVAIKRMHGQYGRDPDFRSMFLDEARLCMRIQHANVVPTLDVVEAGGELLLVMELIEGETLSRLAKMAVARGGRLPMRVATAVVADMLRGLHAAHEALSETGEPLQMVHRDVSPHNVMIGSDGVARVLDFGVAKARGRMQTTQQGQIKGKIAYMSPEQARGKEVDRRSDVFASGIVLWELLLGKRLFEGDNEASVLAQLLTEPPAPLSKLDKALAPYDAILARALHVDPEERYPTTVAFLADLEAKMPIASHAEVASWLASEAGPTLQKRAALIERHLAMSQRSDFDDTPLGEELPPGISALATPRAAPPQAMPSSGPASVRPSRSPPPRPSAPRPRASDPPRPTLDAATRVATVDASASSPAVATPVFGSPPASIPEPRASVPGVGGGPASDRHPPAPASSQRGGRPEPTPPHALAYTMPTPPGGEPPPGGPHPGEVTGQRWRGDFSAASGAFQAATFGTSLMPMVTAPPQAPTPGGDGFYLGPSLARPSDAPPAQSQVSSVNLTTTGYPPPALPAERVKQLWVVGVVTAATVALTLGATLVIVSRHPAAATHAEPAARQVAAVSRPALSRLVASAAAASASAEAATPAPSSAPSSSTSADPVAPASASAVAPVVAPSAAPHSSAAPAWSAPKPTGSSKPPGSGTARPAGSGTAKPAGSSKPAPAGSSKPRH